MFEISFVIRPGGEQHDPRIVAPSKIGECVALCAEEWSKAQDIRGAKEIREDIGDDGAVLQRVTTSRRRLSAVREYPPLTVRRTGKIDSEHVQVAVRGNTHSCQRPQKCGIGIEKRCGEMSLRDKRLRTV